jgi:hypothetical protein
VLLNLRHFRDLVAGKVVTGSVDEMPVEVALADIGWLAMFLAVADAASPNNRVFGPDPPEARELLTAKSQHRERRR